MNIPEGCHIKCFLKSGIAVQGSVIKYSSAYVQIQCHDDNSITIIHHPEDQILITKILPKIQENEKIKPADIEAEIDEALSKPPQYKQEYQYGNPGFFQNTNTK